jgi:hypothetical protein
MIIFRLFQKLLNSKISPDTCTPYIRDGFHIFVRGGGVDKYREGGAACFGRGLVTRLLTQQTCYATARKAKKMFNKTCLF